MMYILALSILYLVRSEQSWNQDRGKFSTTKIHSGIEWRVSAILPHPQEIDWKFLIAKFVGNYEKKI